MTNPLVIYHANCTDGFGAAFCAWVKLGDEAEYFPAHYGICDTPAQIDNLPNLSGRDVYILDFSFKPDVMAAITDLCANLVWLDHHKSAFDDWCGKTYLAEKQQYLLEQPNRLIVLDNERSGCMLSWHHFFGAEQETPPMWVQWIDDRDRWQFKLAASKAFHAGLSIHRPWTFQQWYDMPVNDVVNVGEVVLKAYEQQIKSISTHGKPVTITLGDDEVYIGLAINTNIHMSEIGHELANQSGTFGLVWYLGEGNQAKLSFRSNGHYDVSVIAKFFGGGGHKNAAGCSVPITSLLCWLK